MALEGQAQSGTPGAPTVELFDLAADPYEARDLAAEQPQRVADLRARYEALAREAVPPRLSPKAADFRAPRVWGERD